MDWAGGGANGPILRGEFNAPEMRAWGKKFHAHASAFFGCVAEIDDAAILFFFGGGIDEDHIRAELQLLLKIEEAAMRVDDDRLAAFPEFFSEHVLSGRANRDTGEYPGTAALAVLRFDVGRHVIIVQRVGGGVNGGKAGRVQKHR